MSSFPLRIPGANGVLTIRYVKDHDRSGHFLILHEERSTHEAGDANRLRALGLSRREEEVLYWVAHGKTNAAVSKLLGISPGTVKRHLENIYARLDVEGRHGATVYALQCLHERRPPGR